MPKVYGSSQLWGIVAITAGVTGLVVGGAVFVFMLVRSNDQTVQIKALQQQVEQLTGLQSVSTNQPGVPNESQRSPTGTGLPTSQAQDGTKTTSMPIGGGISVSYPGTYDLFVAEDAGRRGSFFGVDFVPNIESFVQISPGLDSVDFFNTDSIATHQQACATTPDSCQGTYPTSESTFQEQRSLQSGINGTDGEIVKLGGLDWIARTEPAFNGAGFFRRYARFFFDDTRVEVNIWIRDEADAAAADKFMQEQFSIGIPTA